MFKPPRIVSSSKIFSKFSRFKSSFRPSILKRDGNVTVQRVHVKESSSKKASKRVFLNASVLAFIWFFVLDAPFIDTPWKKAAKEEKAEEEKLQQKALQRTEASESRIEQTEAVEEVPTENEEDEAGEQVDIPEQIPEDAIFIPIGIAWKKPQTFYKKTDPEWQSFVTFSKDRQRAQALRNDLAGLVGRHLSGMKNFQKMLGQPIQTRKFWLDIDFPDGPPPEYERSGLEITDDYIAWTTRPVDPIQISRLKAALWPKPVAVSLWSSYSTLWSLQLRRAKQFLGLKTDTNPPSLPPSDIVDFDQLATAHGKEDSSPSTDFEDEEETTNTDPVPNPSPPSKAASSEDVSKLSGAKQRLHNLGVLGTMQDFGAALHVFQHSLIRTWRMPHAPPERGSIMVSGLVELVGTRATCVVDVRAAFHPKDNRWVAVGVGVRRLQAKKQAPRG